MPHWLAPTSCPALGSPSRQRPPPPLLRPKANSPSLPRHPPRALRPSRVPGSVAAAIRKLGHELGIPEAQLPSEAFTFLTRLRYCARDTDTHGPDAEWGEHEVCVCAPVGHVEGETRRDTPPPPPS